MCNIIILHEVQSQSTYGNPAHRVIDYCNAVVSFHNEGIIETHSISMETFFDIFERYNYRIIQTMHSY